jgi:ABC-type bacteriocin/lantibiotic exporter with double-glycine peptidase domain
MCAVTARLPQTADLGPTLTRLRTQVGLIPQISNAGIWNGSIEWNVRLTNRKATFRQVREACRLARLDNEIVGLAKGYKTKATSVNPRVL